MEEIRRGDRFKCIRNVVDAYSPNIVRYYAGSEYTSDKDGYITDLKGQANDWSEDEEWKQFFVKLNGSIKPAHYNNSSVSCIDAMEAAWGTEVAKNFCIGSAFKYLWRHDKKYPDNKKEDLMKAKEFLEIWLKLDKDEA